MVLPCLAPVEVEGKELPMNLVAFRTIQIDGLSIFYREAGAKNAEPLLLLHGLPSSSRMFEPLFVRLSDRYHLIAPDYPGFGPPNFGCGRLSAFSNRRTIVSRPNAVITRRSVRIGGST